MIAYESWSDKCSRGVGGAFAMMSGEEKGGVGDRDSNICWPLSHRSFFSRRDGIFLRKGMKERIRPLWTGAFSPHGLRFVAVLHA